MVFSSLVQSNGSKYSHYDAFADGQKHHFLPQENTRHFWREYIEATDEDNENRPSVSIAERCSPDMPVILNICLVTDDDLGKSYDEDFSLVIFSIIQETQALFFRLLVQDPDNDVDCAVILSPDRGIITNYNIAYNYRIQFPYCRLPLIFQRNVLLPKIIEAIRMRNLEDNIPVRLVADWKQIIDVCDSRTPVSLYGSVDNATKIKYVFTNIVKSISDLDLDDVAEMPGDVFDDLENCFDPRNHEDVAKGLLRPEDYSGYPKESLICIFLSLRYCMKISQTKELSERAAPLAAVNKNNSRLAETASSESPDTMIEQLMPMFPWKLAVTNVSVWLEIGRALNFCYRGTNQGLKFWTELTEKNTKHDKTKCAEYYWKMDSPPYITHRTIAWYIRLYCPERYTEWNNRWCMPVLEELISRSDKFSPAHIAQLIYRRYWLEFVYENDHWYVYDTYTHGWNKYKHDCENLKMKIINDLSNYLIEMRANISQRQSEISDVREKGTLEPQVKAITKLIDKVQSYESDKLVRFSRCFFSMHQRFMFEKQLNMNPRLMRVKNGVLEVVSDRVIFRQGKPEDYLSMVAGVKYNEKLDYKSKSVREFMDLMNKFFINKDLVRYFLKLNATYIRAGNFLKSFIALVGEAGNNGKSTYNELVAYTFGDYFVDVPVSLLTGKRAASNAPCPELAQLKYARVASSKESGKKETINGGVLKELTGKDGFFARGLNENGGRIKPQFKFFIHVNKMNNIDGADQAIMNRYIQIPFLSKFDKNAPDNIEEQFKMRHFAVDPNFDEKFDYLGEAFLWVIVEYYHVYCAEGLAVPDEVNEYTNKYWNESNFYRKYYDSKIVKHDDINSFIDVNKAWVDYAMWFKVSYPNKSNEMGDFDDFNHNMSLILGKATGVDSLRWYGFRQKRKSRIATEINTNGDEEGIDCMA